MWVELFCGRWDLSSPTRDWTCVPCIAWRVLNHWTTREIPSSKTEEGDERNMCNMRVLSTQTPWQAWTWGSTVQSCPCHNSAASVGQRYISWGRIQTGARIPHWVTSHDHLDVTKMLTDHQAKTPFPRSSPHRDHPQTEKNSCFHFNSKDKKISSYCKTWEIKWFNEMS